MVEEKTDQLENIISMLNGSTEDAIVALTVIDNLFDERKIMVLLAYKFSKCSYELWAEHAPKTWAYVKEVTNSDATIPSPTFNQIFKELIKLDTEVDDEIFFNRMANYLTGTCLNMGHDFMNNVEIKMKMK